MRTAVDRQSREHLAGGTPYIPPEYDKIPVGTPDWDVKPGQASNWNRLLVRMLNETEHKKLLLAARALEDAIFLRYLELATAPRNKDWAKEKMEMRRAAKVLRKVLCEKYNYGRSEQKAEVKTQGEVPH
jgi:hypothetical protein